MLRTYLILSFMANEGKPVLVVNLVTYPVVVPAYEKRRRGMHPDYWREPGVGLSRENIGNTPFGQ